jgi:hypothetical protein
MKTKYFGILFFLIVFNSCNLIISGSYPYSEEYTFDISREELITKIKEFKEKNPNFKVMTTFENGEVGELHGGMNSQDTLNVFYAIYFYKTDLQMTLLCVINMSKEISTRPATIQLVGMTKSKNFGSWKTINSKDLSKEDNTQIKSAFESQILDKLGEWKRD